MRAARCAHARALGYRSAGGAPAAWRHDPGHFFDGPRRRSNERARDEGRAVYFLEKPVTRETLLDAIKRALEGDNLRRKALEAAKRKSARLSVLTAREREVFDRIVAGKLNKHVADELGISLRTVKAYRAQVMQKLGVDTAAELGKFAGEQGDVPG